MLVLSWEEYFSMEGSAFDFQQRHFDSLTVGLDFSTSSLCKMYKYPSSGRSPGSRVWPSVPCRVSQLVHYPSTRERQGIVASQTYVGYG